ncbi:3-oxoacyl-[acyl-carrier protein] reductase [Natronocella acetinitrilica]|uniref:3-oxoacyl-[acyl-carrier-protein] reductase n=1 Tax=Natronocella acetinitrilica TaxID=414046 RepID=A0AAE3KDH1_9GAMM|nr:3-oxoacyl-ACP reductase FabG [Natronocella acetinitrilica]MCP1676293.1 3-oxoacyl-[acyl-carrier protein] reductase [Natronocella acetinitrilica]
MSDASPRVALVTGATRGIGKAIALALGAQGVTVVGTATSDNGAKAISDYLAEAGVAGEGLRLDVTSADDVGTVVAAVTERHGVPTILVNNAGITRDNLFMRMKDDEWDSIIDTNLSSVYRVTKACVRGMMKARWGRIINISSVVGSTGNPGQVNYAAAKAGMQGMTRSLARELGSRGVTANCVSPGFIDTDMTRALADAQREELANQIPLGKLGQPKHIAATVAFLASDAAEYITGENIHVNGGMFMH